jgi:hypothetical protein
MLSPKTRVSIAAVKQVQVSKEAPKRFVLVHVARRIDVNEPPIPVTTRIITAESGSIMKAMSTLSEPR